MVSETEPAVIANQSQATGEDIVILSRWRPG